jgi:Holliday junction resolvase
MALTPEAKVKARVKKILDAHGAYYFFPATGGYGRSGVTDIVVCFKGRFIGIECKAGKNEPTALQHAEMDRIVNAGGVAVWVNETNADETVTRILNTM